MIRKAIAAAIGLALASGPVLAEPAAVFERASDAALLGNPHDLKLSPDGRYLLVSDVGNGRVLILDPETLSPVGDFGAGEQNGTHDVDFDAKGRVLVADTQNHRIAIYEMAGLKAKLVGEIKGGFRAPEGVLAHPNGRIYVAGAWSGNVLAFKNGKVVARLDGLSSPHDLEVTSAGDIWLADAGNNRMLLLSPDLKIRRELKGPPYNFNGVRYQDVLKDGTLIAADKYTHSIKIIAPDGRLLLVIGTGKPGRGEGVFTTPEGVETRGDVVWFSDSGNNRVVRYRLKLR